MRIADIVMAVTTIAGRRQFFSRLSLARAELANEVRLGQGSLTGACSAPLTDQFLIGMLGALRPAGPAA
jgi:hypothetical protein